MEFTLRKGADSYYYLEIKDGDTFKHISISHEGNRSVEDWTYWRNFFETLTLLVGK